MTIPDWFGYRALKAFLLVNPFLHVAGLGLSIWAWKATRKTGYLVVALYFVVVLLGKGFPGSLRVTAGPPAAPALTAQQQQDYTREMTAVDKRYYPAGHPVTQTVVFPLGPIILVAGLWVLVKRDIERHTQAQTSPGVITPAPPA